jgi:hypothetical protein
LVLRDEEFFHRGDAEALRNAMLVGHSIDAAFLSVFASLR